jgi:hypothetical protein
LPVTQKIGESSDAFLLVCIASAVVVVVVVSAGESDASEPVSLSGSDVDDALSGVNSPVGPPFALLVSNEIGALSEAGDFSAGAEALAATYAPPPTVVTAAPMAMYFTIVADNNIYCLFAPARGHVANLSHP